MPMGNRTLGAEQHCLRRDVSKAAAAFAGGTRVSAEETTATLKPSVATAFVVGEGHALVETVAAKVRGFSERGTDTYLGVPYGAPTGGPARFQPPAKPAP